MRCGGGSPAETPRVLDNQKRRNKINSQTRIRKELPNKLANLSRKIAFRDKVSTNSILNPMLKRQGFENETWSITVGFDEDLDKVPSKQIMEDFGLLD